MPTKNLSKLSKKDKEWQRAIKKRLESERVRLEHPEGKERFDIVIRNIKKKKR
jgi:hypothetical protein